MATVTIHKGTYRNNLIVNQTFDLIRGYKEGVYGGFITVYDGEKTMRVKVDSQNHYEISGELVTEKRAPVMEYVETDEEIMDRIETRFGILEEMTRAAITNDIRAMIVVGPPGVGKSYGVERELDQASLFDQIAGTPIKHTIVKGALTPIGLYTTLYNYSDSNNVIVFDDSDGVFSEELSLNLLKAALDSGKRRRICWNSDSYMLRREGIPDSFDFKGSIIFITNLNLEHVKSKKLQDHLEALRSRCHYLDLTMNTEREKFLRIKQIHRTGTLFNSYSFDEEMGNHIIDFMEINKTKLREVSLRMALKIADLTKVSPVNWKALAEATCMVN